MRAGGWDKSVFPAWLESRGKPLIHMAAISHSLKLLNTRNPTNTAAMLSLALEGIVVCDSVTPLTRFSLLFIFIWRVTFGSTAGKQWKAKWEY